jgi:hypothetical protein
MRLICEALGKLALAKVTYMQILPSGSGRLRLMLTTVQIKPASMATDPDAGDLALLEIWKTVQPAVKKSPAVDYDGGTVGCHRHDNDPPSAHSSGRKRVKYSSE